MATIDPPAPYQVVYSGLVQQRLLALAKEAAVRGDGSAFAAALKEFHRRLTIYPQFGDPLIDLTEEPGQIYNGIIPPVSMRYGVYDDRRLVQVVASPDLMAQPKAG